LNYKIIHTTSYTYHDAVSLCHNIARLIPRSFDKQICRSASIIIDPLPEITNEYKDFFGNEVLYFAIQHEHEKLTVTATSEIEKLNVRNPEMDLYTHTSWEEIKDLFAKESPELFEISQYIPETTMTAATPEISAYALPSYLPGKSMYEATFHLMNRIHHDFEFKPGFTTVATPLSVVMQKRKGVCQDFAHLAIACIRSLGLPVRYISGYLETVPPEGEEKLTGVDASHAWFSVFIPGHGWLDFDPTNNVIPAAQHITACWGRDYSDIAPLKGIINNSGPHDLIVSVDVKRMM
jgi:transglutaminase-like putative cysteine protease